MNRTLLAFTGLLALLYSCNGQVQSQSRNQAPGDVGGQLGNNIMLIFQDSKNNYWFGSWETGLYKFDGHTVVHYTTAEGLPHNRVDDIQEDRGGNLLINTPEGLCKYDGQTFSVLTPKPNGEWKLQPNDLWFKSLQFNGDMYRYDGKELYRLKFPSSPRGKEWMADHPTNPDPHGVYTIYKDSKGNVWFGTAAVGACRYNGKSFDWISEEDVTELHDGPSNGVRSIIEDKEGYFWFNSAYRYKAYGASIFADGKFYIREKSIGNLDGAPDSDLWEYMSIARDDQGDLWIATYWSGVWRYDGQKTTYYPVQAGGKDITMFCIYKDKRGDLWLGTHENGAYKFNGKSFERFVP